MVFASETRFIRGKRLFVSFPRLWENWEETDLESELIEHFTRYGQVMSVKIIDKSRAGKCMAIIKMMSLRGAELTYFNREKQEMRIFGGVFLKIDYLRPRNYETKMQRSKTEEQEKKARTISHQFEPNFRATSPTTKKKRTTKATKKSRERLAFAMWNPTTHYRKKRKSPFQSEKSRRKRSSQGSSGQDDHFKGRASTKEQRHRVVAGGDDFNVDAEAVELTKEQIGTGATSRVFKGKFKVSDNVTTEVACKEFMVSMTLKHKMRLQKEINYLRTLRHPNVLKHFGVDFNRSLLITELLEKKFEIHGEVVNVHSARDLLDLHEFKPIPWSTRLQIVHGVTSGLSFLHKNNVIHCDLKTGNVFVGDNGEGGYLIKLGDFGTAMFDFTQFTASVMPSATKDNAIMCTAAYTAPELFQMGCKHSFESDIYSLAIFMVEFSLPNRSTPWEGEVANSAIIHDLLRRGERPTISLDDLSELKEDIAKRWMTLLHDCWQQDPKKRPTSEQAALNISSIYNEVSGDTYKSFHEWKERNTDVIYTSLNTHQTMAIDVVDEVVATFASQDLPIPPALNVDLSHNLAQNDGTNSCVYFCTKIADDILCSDLCREVDNTHGFVKRVSEATIRTLPALINPVREIGVFIDVDTAIALLNQRGIISRRYTTTELLKQQSSRTLQEKQNYLKSALIDLKRSATDDGKALAIYMCHPYAFIVGFVRSSYIILDTHKVPDEAGGSNSGLLLQFRLRDENHETVTDSIVDWISLRMRASIPDYSTKIHSLVLLQMTDTANDEMGDFVTSDTDDEQLINASMEMEENEKSFSSTEANILLEKEYVSSDSSEIGQSYGGWNCVP